MIFKQSFKITKKFNKNFCQMINIINDINHKEEIDLIEDHLKKKIKEFQKNKSSLKIISDFDYTLTQKYHSIHGNLYSSYAILNYSSAVSEKFKKTSKALFRKYSPIENDATIDFETRDKMIKEWFMDDLNLMLSEKITKSDFKNMVRQSEKKFFFRYGILEMFEILFHNNIPIYIISGGIKEIIEETLRLLLPHYDSMVEKNMIHIISNSFEFDQNGVMIGLKEPFVYTFNKGEVLKELFKDVQHENLILMGDHINDTDSIKYLNYINEIKIGFINYKEDTLKEQLDKLKDNYQQHYDVSIINDGNLSFVNNLLKVILGDEEAEKRLFNLIK